MMMMPGLKPSADRRGDASEVASRNLRTGVDPTGEEPGQSRGKGAWAGKAGQQLSIPAMKGRTGEEWRG